MKYRKKWIFKQILIHVSTVGLISLSLALFFLIKPTNVVSAEPQKIAVICVDPKLGEWKKFFNAPRLIHEIKGYSDRGYKVVALKGTADEVLRALLDKNVKAITFVGEGGLRIGTIRHVPTLAGNDAAGWKRKVQLALEKRYYEKGLEQKEAHRRAIKESQNFGLDIVVNYSCWSLADVSIAELFVKPAGVYYGSSVMYSACPLNFPYFLWTDKAQYFLEEYHVQPLQRQRQQRGKETQVFVFDQRILSKEREKLFKEFRRRRVPGAPTAVAGILYPSNGVIRAEIPGLLDCLKQVRDEYMECATSRSDRGNCWHILEDGSRECARKHKARWSWD